VLTPVLASALFAVSGLRVILLIDLGSFAVAFLVLLFLISILESETGEENSVSVLAGCKEGFVFLAHNRGIFTVVLTIGIA